MSKALPAALLLVSLTALPAAAGDLRSPDVGFGLGRLSAERYRQPYEAKLKVDRARRALSGDTSLDAVRAERELDEIEADADRALRTGRYQAPAAVPGRGLLGAGEELLPYPRSLRDRAVVYGTARNWVRVGDLLSGAEQAASGGDLATARALHGQARGLYGELTQDMTPSARRDDPQVAATEARIEALGRRLPDGS
jgi:hypothetical protein